MTSAVSLLCVEMCHTQFWTYHEQIVGLTLLELFATPPPIPPKNKQKRDVFAILIWPLAARLWSCGGRTPLNDAVQHRLGKVAGVQQQSEVT
eukprot:859503-Amphidinium_carterae.1